MNNPLDIDIRRAVCNSPHCSYPHAQRLTQLMLAEERLARLEAGGVNNWEWYHESLHPTDKPSLDDFEEALNNVQP